MVPVSYMYHHLSSGIDSGQYIPECSSVEQVMQPKFERHAVQTARLQAWQFSL